MVVVPFRRTGVLYGTLFGAESRASRGRVLARMLGTFPGFVSSGFLIILATFLSAVCIRKTQAVEEIKEDILRGALNKNYSETEIASFHKNPAYLA